MFRSPPQQLLLFFLFFYLSKFFSFPLSAITFFPFSIPFNFGFFFQQVFYFLFFIFLLFNFNFFFLSSLTSTFFFFFFLRKMQDMYYSTPQRVKHHTKMQDTMLHPNVFFLLLKCVTKSHTQDLRPLHRATRSRLMEISTQVKNFFQNSTHDLLLITKDIG